jgi:DNA-binding response OmpR family regulator
MAARRLLVVDDDPEVCEVISLALVDAGHVLECAHNAKDALKLAAATTPHLSIVDLLLPGGINGIELAAQLCAMGSPVVMMSGAVDGGERVAPYGYPYLAKPFHLAD